MNLLNSLDKVRFHTPFFKRRTLFSLASYYLLERYFLKKTISFPKLINFLPTLRCNLRCSICHSKDSLQKNSQEEMDTQTILNFITRVRAFSPDFHFSGGEPFARKDLFEFFNLIHSQNMRASLVTNGLLLQEKNLEKFLPGSISAVIFSVLGIKEDHDAEVGLPGAFAKLCHNLKMLHSLHPKTKIFINSPTTPKILQNIDTYKEHICSLPVDGVKFTHLNWLTTKELADYKIFAIQNEFQNLNAHSHVTDEDLSFLKNALKKNPFENFSIPWQNAPQLSMKELDGWYHSNWKLQRFCHFIWHSTYIYPDGEVKSCHFLQEPFGNIQKEDILSIWNSKNYNRFRNLISKCGSPGCNRCCKL